jgi:hypothetical protein
MIFLRHSTELQENLDRDLHNQALDFMRSTQELLQSKQLGRWPARAARARPTPASWRASGRARPHAHLGAVGCRGWGGEVAGGEVQRRPAAVATAAREKSVRWSNVGQQASARASLGSREANRAVGRRRARAASSSTGRRRQWRQAARTGVRRSDGALLYAAWRVRDDEG